MNIFPDWDNRLSVAIADLVGGQTGLKVFLDANSDAVKQALNTGGRVVVNISTAHIPAFIKGEQYKNCYDLDAEARIGEKPSRTSPKRRMVDEALRPLHQEPIERIYFAAVELNGYGVGFYGDCCLVLRDDISQENIVVLDRNSYDLIREPLRSRIVADAKNKRIEETSAREQEAAKHAGCMRDHLASIAAIKVLESRQPVQRLMTTGIISDGVLDDEDYIEVLRPRSFKIETVQEVRLAPADVAMDERIRSHALGGEPPSQAEALWRKRRRRAEACLRALNVPVRVVTTTGRVKG